VSPSSVTLRVDMTTQEAVSENGVHVAGNFQGWNPGASALDDSDGDGIWELVLEMAPGEYQFKFVNGNDWGGAGAGNIDNENPVGDCVIDGNRSLTVGEESQVYEACYNNCPGIACAPDPEAAEITFRVNMDNEDVSLDGVYLISSFTSPAWQEGAVSMTDADGDNVWEVTVNVSGPADLFYKFTNGDPFPGGEADYSVEESGSVMGADSVEVSFESEGCGVPNGFGAFNRLHVRSGAAEILDIACYNSCSNCGSGISEISRTGLKLYPNPAESYVVLEISKTVHAAMVSVTDSSGRLVLNKSYTSLTGIVTIDTRSLLPGMYQVSVSNSEFASVKRFVVK
ncbi:MAG: T9SS type A sorting domain-containing protein, partial [Flavobacteriales bacterium]